MDGLLAAAREALGMELAYLAELDDRALILRGVDGDRAAFGGVAPGFTLPRDHSWCHAMVAGEVPQLVTDAQASPAAAAHPFVVATGIRAYAGVPVVRGGRLGLRLALLPEPAPAPRARRARPALPLRPRAHRRRADRRTRRAPSLHRRAEVEAAAGQALIAALNARENYTAEHSEAVLELALAVAAELGMDAEDATAVGQVALLHDIGKVGVPDAILRKPGGLTAPEWDVMREHPAIGARIVDAIGSLSHLAPAVRAEHERWDGSGYPDGLAGEDVPLAEPHLPRLRRLARDDLRPPVPPRAAPRRRRGSSSSATPARSSARRRSPRCCACSTAATSPATTPAAETTTELPRMRPDRPLEAELRALIAVSSAVAAAHRFDEVLDAVGEQACFVLRAASISISRCEVEHDWMRTLANAGELHPGEDPRPTLETWPLSPLDRRLVDLGEPYVVVAHRRRHPGGGARLPRADRARLGAGVPDPATAIGSGACWRRTPRPARHRSAPRTSASPRRCARRSRRRSAARELFSRLETLAYEDPLTRLPNRRALDVRLEEAVARAEALDGELALLFCDLDALKEVNDLHGHDAGDRALIATGAALSAAAEAYPGSFTSRLGGDEFCVLMEGHGADAARALAREAGERLATVPGGPFAFSCGVAVLDAEHRHAGDLFRAADAAQYAAKRVGGGSVFVAEPGLADPGAGARLAAALPRRAPRRTRGARPLRARRARRRPRGAAEPRSGSRPSRSPSPGRSTRRSGRSRAARPAPRRSRPRSRPSATRVRVQRRGRGVPARRLPADRGDPRARRRLRRRRRRRRGRPRRARAARRVGPRAVLAAAALDRDGAGWLVELFGDRHSAAGLTAALPELRLLVAEAVARAQPATSDAKDSKTST